MSKIKLMDRPGLTAVANVVWLALFSFLAHRRGPADWMGLGWALLALDSGRTVARAVAQIIGERWAEWDAKKIEGFHARELHALAERRLRGEGVSVGGRPVDKVTDETGERR